MTSELGNVGVPSDAGNHKSMWLQRMCIQAGQQQKEAGKGQREILLLDSKPDPLPFRYTYPVVLTQKTQLIPYCHFCEVKRYKSFPKVWLTGLLKWLVAHNLICEGLISTHQPGTTQLSVNQCDHQSNH